MTNFSESLRKAWERFEHSANWSILHPNDRERLVKFLIQARNEGHELGESLIDNFYNQNFPGARDELVSQAEEVDLVLGVYEQMRQGL